MKIDRTKLRNVAEIHVNPESEDRSYRMSFEDPETVRWIEEQLTQGSEWAWCTVQVSAIYGELRSNAYLGSCSYESREGFIRDSGYYSQLVAEAVEGLALLLEEVANDHEIWEHDEELCMQCIVKGSNEAARA